MKTATRAAVATGASVAVLSTLALVALTAAIRAVYGVDAPFEDFMPLWAAQAAYWVNEVIDILGRIL